MPGPTFASQLATALQELEKMPDEWIDRRSLQELLGMSKSTTWRLLKKLCHFEPGPAGILLCRRTDLVASLHQLLENGAARAPLARRSHVEQMLDAMHQFVVRNHNLVARPGQGLALVNSRFGSLPPGVDLTPSELRIRFFGTEDFLGKFGAVVYALQNDYEKISAFIEAGSPSASKSQPESKPST